MNRTIKFRGQQINTKKWIYGYLYKEKGLYLICENIRYAKEEPILLDTTGQFTGLHDKNGKEIYEGDIVKVNNEIITKVIWDKDYLGYFLYANEENSIDSFENGEQPLYDYFGSIEVIRKYF